MNERKDHKKLKKLWKTLPKILGFRKEYYTILKSIEIIKRIQSKMF